MVGEGRRDGVSVCFGGLGILLLCFFLFGCLTVWLTDESFRWDAYSPTCTYVSIEINRVGLPFCLKVASRTKGFSKARQEKRLGRAKDTNNGKHFFFETQ